MNPVFRFRPLLLAALLVVPVSGVVAQFAHFVTTNGDRLMDGTKELRFISFNIPNLAYIEDNYKFTEGNPWRVADAYEIRDALESIRQIGGKVVRMYTPSVRKEMDDSTIVRHVTGPGEFNEEAFRAYDKILQTANEVGVRVIIPLLDNWWWWGGPKEYARFRGMDASEFWTDTLLIADFKSTAAHIINRVNSYTGVPYRDDKAILCWETGNELECPEEWNLMIARYIRELDTNHLVMAGSFEKEISEAYLADPAIGIVQTHHYDTPERDLAYVRTNRALAKTRKPYIVGEFGFIPTASMQTILDTVIADGTSGIMVWSLRQHNRDGGFYYHQNSYRWPGFPSGHWWDEIAVDSLFHAEACAIDSLSPTPLPVPAPPRLLPIETPYKISWQGSAGASSYIIERRETGMDTAWSAIATGVSDANARYRPLFSDTTVQVGRSYEYRVKAANGSGVSEASQAVGPVEARYRLLVDDMADSSRWFASEGSFEFLTMDGLVKAKEDADRVVGEDGDYILYRLPDSLASVSVQLFATTADTSLELRVLTGAVPDSLTLCPARRSVYPNRNNEYGFFTPMSFSASGFSPRDRFVKIELADDTQLARIEIVYGRRPPSSASSSPGGRE
jgi:mannan endo-1,4-beta-mannosidase